MEAKFRFKLQKLNPITDSWEPVHYTDRSGLSSLSTIKELTKFLIKHDLKYNEKIKMNATRPIFKSQNQKQLMR